MNRKYSSPFDSMNTVLVGISRVAQQMPLAWFAFLVLCVGVLRQGPLGIGPEIIQMLRADAHSFPTGHNYMSTSLGPVLLMKLLGGVSDVQWWAIHCLLWIIVVALLYKMSRKAAEWRRIGLVALVLAPAFSTTVTMLGNLDLYVLAGALLVVFAPRRILVLVGAALATSGNPELATMSAVGLFVLALALRNRDLKVRATFYLILAGAGTILGSVWLVHSGVASRMNIASNGQSEWRHALRSFLGYWPLALFAGLGGMWLIVLACLQTLERRSRLLAAISIIAIPAVASFLLSHDGTRVFAISSSAALAALLQQTWKVNWREIPPPSRLLGAMLLLLVLTPAVIVDASGGIRAPYEDLLNHGGWHGYWTSVPYVSSGTQP